MKSGFHQLTLLGLIGVSFWSTSTTHTGHFGGKILFPNWQWLPKLLHMKYYNNTHSTFLLLLCNLSTSETCELLRKDLVTGPYVQYVYEEFHYQLLYLRCLQIQYDPPCCGNCCCTLVGGAPDVLKSAHFHSFHFWCFSQADTTHLSVTQELRPRELRCILAQHDVWSLWSSVVSTITVAWLVANAWWLQYISRRHFSPTLSDFLINWRRWPDYFSIISKPITVSFQSSDGVVFKNNMTCKMLQLNR